MEAQEPRTNKAGARAVDRLTLFASPVFVLMAAMTAHGRDTRIIICDAGHGLAWDGMTTMYLLMSFVHLPPWVRLLRTGKPKILHQTGDLSFEEEKDANVGLSAGS